MKNNVLVNRGVGAAFSAACSLLVAQSISFAANTDVMFRKLDQKVLKFISKPTKLCTKEGQKHCYGVKEISLSESVRNAIHDGKMDMMDILNLECGAHAESLYNNAMRSETTSLKMLSDAQTLADIGAIYSNLFEAVVREVGGDKMAKSTQLMQSYTEHVMNGSLEVKKFLDGSRECGGKASGHSEKLKARGISLDQRALLNGFQTKDFCRDLQQLEGPSSKKTSILGEMELRKDCFYQRSGLEVVDITQQGVVALARDLNLESGKEERSLIFVERDTAGLKIGRKFDATVKYFGSYDYYLPSGTRVIKSFKYLDETKYPFLYNLVRNKNRKVPLVLSTKPVETKPNPAQAKQKPVQAKQKPVQAKQKPVQAKQK